MVANVFMKEYIFVKAKNVLSYDLSTAAIVLGTLFGLFTPFFSNYWPIKTSLSKNLRDSLDLSRNKSADAIGIKVQKLENVGISFNQLSISLLLIVMGILVYYGVPLSFLNQNYLSAFLILGLLLILIIIGLTFMCSLVFSLIERLMLWLTLVTCCRRDRRLHSLIRKQMEGHQIRNQKTSIIFTLAVAFLLFSASYFQLLAEVIEKAFSKLIGADIYVYNIMQQYENGICMNETAINIYLDSVIAENPSDPLITGYTYTSVDLHAILSND